MKYQRRTRKAPVAARRGTAAPTVHPAQAPRPATGSKGDAWVVSLPTMEAAAGGRVLAFDTGLDSATIVIGGDHGDVPRAHPRHDLAVVVTAGAGELRHGPARDRLEAVRYAAPCTIVVPAGCWHAIVPDPGSPPVTAFFTRPGQAIDPFSEVAPRAEPGLVHLDTLPVALWEVLPAEAVAADLFAPGPTGAGTAMAAGPVPTATRPARVVPYEQPDDGYTLALDTGTDSLFVMASRGRSWDRAPVDVPVHRHDREDELIVLDAGEGWLLNGATLDSVVRTAWRAPCVLVMPAGNLHRVVRTDDVVGDAILVYAHRSQVTATWRGILAEMHSSPLAEDAAGAQEVEA